jgi:hypothetical protein
MPKLRKKEFTASKEVRAIARERVGTVKPGQTIIPKDQRKPKHKANLLNADLVNDSGAPDQ